MSGYSGTPLVKKLGIKPGFNCLFDNAPDHYFDLLIDMPEIKIKDMNCENGSIDFIHLFIQYEQELHESWQQLKEKLSTTGMLWVSWPKGASKLPTDVNGNLVRQIGLEGGLVDVKVCAVDDDWSGLKFVYRTKDR